MKILNLYCNHLIYIIILLTIFFSKIIVANENLENRVKNLTLELRCMTCQNQSVYESQSDFSKNIIKVVEEKFLEGLNKDEIKSFLVNRYGEYILFKPILDKKNLLLWLFPFILLTISFIVFLIKLIKK